MNFEEIKDRFFKLRNEIERFGRDIRIVVVTKYVSDLDVISKLSEIGVVDIGESYAQEMEYKYKELKNKNFPVDKYKWHFIGHLQKNKVKKVVPISCLIQSVDSVELLEKINLEAQKINKVQSCLLELKVSDEPTKFGIEEEKIHQVVEKIILLGLSNISICGLMTMAPYFENPEDTRPYFKKAYKVFCDLRKKVKNFDILSMGMSNDYIVALEEGANMIRVGSLLFGQNSSSCKLRD